MKSAHTDPARTDGLMTLGLALLLLPVVVALFVDEQNGTAWAVRGWLRGENPLRFSVALLAAGLCGWALVVVLWRGRLAWGAGLLLLAALVQAVSPIDRSLAGAGMEFKMSPRTNFIFHKNGHGANASREFAGPVYRRVNGSVSCNGVELGTTSDAIARKDFETRVKPLAAPPRQALLATFLQKDRDAVTSQQLNSLLGLGFTALPCNPGMTANPMPGAWREDSQAFAAYLAKQRYWWTFRLRGATAVGFPGEVSFSPPWRDRPAAIQFSIWFPLRERHADALLAALRAAGGPPPAAWIRHVLDYEAILVPELCWRAQGDPAFRPPLEALARAKYGFEGKLDAAGYAGVLKRILENVKREGRFDVPSLESAALDQFGAAAEEVVGRAWLAAAAARHEMPGRPYDTTPHNLDGVTWAGNTPVPEAPEALELGPLDYALARLRPRVAFNRLAYEAGLTPVNYQDTRLASLIGQYQKPEAVEIVRRMLRAWEEKRDVFAINRVAEVARAVNNPMLERDFRGAIETLADPQDPFTVKTFAQSRIGRAGIDQAELARWIERTPALKDKEKIELIRQIESPVVVEILRRIVGTQGGALANFFWDYRPTRPNPFLEPFLRGVFEECRARLKPGMDSIEKMHTRVAAEKALGWLAASGAPAAQEFLARLWESGAEGKDWVLRGLGQPNLDVWQPDTWVKRIRGLSDPALMESACHTLFWIGTSEAYELLSAWTQQDSANSADDEVAKLARYLMSEWNKGTLIKIPPSAAEVARREAELRRQGAELIAGKIQPDDLLGAGRGWVWREGRYVRE